MLEPILTGKGKLLLLGNEAIVRGAFESGVGVATTYPGTPASEIGDTFAALARKAGVYFEYSTNEKVATEAAAGAAFCGVRSMVSFKHFGLNVATDSIYPMAYTGVKAGMVIAFADDPACWSSGQSEQDSRYHARIAHMPMLEPSEAQECKDYTKMAFDLSEKFGIPVFMRMTTRVTHQTGIVNLGKVIRGKTEGKFIKGLQWRNFPPQIMNTHAELNEKLAKMAAEYAPKFSMIIRGKGKKGIITSGAAFGYVMEALDDFKLKLPVLKLGMTYPVPEKIIAGFIKGLDSVLIVEDLEAVLENDVRCIAKDANPKLKIFGKNLIPAFGEVTEEKVMVALSKLTGKKASFDFEKHRKMYQKINMARRMPLLCPGCPHRASFYAAKTVIPDAVFAGDIGCYILGIHPPLETQDFFLSMGASAGVSHGITKVSRQKPIVFMGDSTFFHAGIPAIINMVYNKSNPLVIILDNRITAMTGHQPNPGMGVTGMGEQTKALDIAEIARACGVENVKTINVFNFKELTDAIREFSNKDKVSVIVSKGECRLLTVRKLRDKGVKVPKFQIDQIQFSGECGKILHNFGCPAIIEEKGQFRIDEELCFGCAVCPQLCKPGTIKVSQK
jgi:indolepyruvate ferredoxin oxidoreductase alpha subunit